MNNWSFRCAKILLSSLLVSAATLTASPAIGIVSTILVSTTSDVVNGDTSSVSSLLANPGADGISLREAILATNNSQGTESISFAPSLKGQTISLTSPLPPLRSGGVTISGDTDGTGEAEVTLDKAPSFQGLGTGLTIASSFNTINALTLSGFGIGIDIDPPPLNSQSLATHETFNGNTVSNMNMENIQQFGVLMGSMYLQGCGLFGGTATPCTTDDTWSNTAITGNTIETMDTGFAIKDSDAGDTFSNVTVAKNTIAVQGYDGAISVEIGSNATGSSVSGVIISGNKITGQTGEGIDVGPGTNRAVGNRIEQVQILDNSVDLVNKGLTICCQGIVLFAGTDAPSATDPNVLPLGYPDSNSLTDVLVKGNDVSGTLTTGILVQAGLGAGGSSNSISDISIANNQVNTSLKANGIKVVNGSGTPLGGRVATSNHISTVSIDANRVATGVVPLQPTNGYGAIDIEGGGDPSVSNGISNVNIVNDVVTSSNSAVVVIGGEGKSGMTSGNTVQGLRLENDTLVNPSGNVLDVAANSFGATEDMITGLNVVNCILWGSIEGQVTPSMLSHSLVQKSSWSGRNGNVTGDPRFTNVAGDNFQLLPKSPARAAGTSLGAPAIDINGRARTSRHIDIGAYQSS